MVDEPFEEGGRLGPARPAVGAHGRGVGDGDDDVELDGREAVGAVGHALGPGRQEGADAGIGAAVADEPDAQPGERAVPAAAELGVLDLATGVGERDEVIGACGRPRDRTPEVARRRGDRRVLDADPRLATERATDTRGDHVHRAGVDAERAPSWPGRAWGIWLEA